MVYILFLATHSLPKHRPPQTLYFQGFARVAAYIWLLWALHCQVKMGESGSPTEILTSPTLPYRDFTLHFLYTLVDTKNCKVPPLPKSVSWRKSTRRSKQSRGFASPTPIFQSTLLSPFRSLLYTFFTLF